MLPSSLPVGKIAAPSDLAEVVKARRKAQGLTQADLAGLAGTGNRFIVDLEKGKPTLQIEKVFTVLSLLGIDLYVKERGA